MDRAARGDMQHLNLALTIQYRLPSIGRLDCHAPRDIERRSQIVEAALYHNGINRGIREGRFELCGVAYAHLSKRTEALRQFDHIIVDCERRLRTCRRPAAGKGRDHPEQDEGGARNGQRHQALPPPAANVTHGPLHPDLQCWCETHA